MRHLLFLILSSFFFIAPMQGEAAEVGERQTFEGISIAGTAEDLVDYAIRCDSSPIAVSANTRKSNSQTRHLPYANFANTIALANRASRLHERDQFIHPYFYCKRIGLRLVFPQHYYW
jgi:hypothetical protein